MATIYKKSRNSFFEKTGYDSPLQVPEIKEKSRQTCLEKYGYEYALQVPEIKEKSRQTYIKHYGVDHPNKSPEHRAKVANTFYKNGTISTSKQQYYIYNLYKSESQIAELNYPVSQYNVDICFPKEKLTVEVDFGGHNLSVKLGACTQEQFDKKELVRDKVIKKEGYKVIRIKSKIDLLPSDQILLQMLNEAKQYFSEYPSHSWIEYDIDNSMVCNAEFMNGVKYNYGELRRIKDSDLIEYAV